MTTNSATATTHNIHASIVEEWPGEDIDGRDTYDELSAYCLFRVVVDGAEYRVGACVGVPDYLRGTAAAAGHTIGLFCAWWSDASDWQDLPDAITQDLVFEHLNANARRLFRSAVASR